LQTGIALIVGLGNPGKEHDNTRHNAGFWLIDELASGSGATFKHESKFNGDVCKANINGHACWLLKPDTYMNRSGQAVTELANFYKIPSDAILVVHDEIDLPPGVVRLKQGGGHGGHNGLRDIIARTGKKDFYRLRIGVGHPGTSDAVSGYVLNKPPSAEKDMIDTSIRDALDVIQDIVSGNFQNAMQELHSKN